MGLQHLPESCLSSTDVGRAITGINNPLSMDIMIASSARIPQKEFKKIKCSHMKLYYGSSLEIYLRRS